MPREAESTHLERGGKEVGQRDRQNELELRCPETCLLHRVTERASLVPDDFLVPGAKPLEVSFHFLPLGTMI